MANVRVIVDGYGGDHAPLAVLQGCAMAISEYPDVDLLITGDTAALQKLATEHQISLERIELMQAAEVVKVEDDYSRVFKEKPDSSMAVGLKALKEGRGDAFVSGGSTGALVVGSSLIVKRIPGIKRAALAPIMPAGDSCFMLMDAGANVTCRPEMFQQFAIMGSSYMSKIMGVANPRVGLVNIGTEENKGGELQLEAYPLLQNTPVNFIGNIEAREIPTGGCDVAIADGFTGNVILKLEEGMGKYLIEHLKGIFYSGIAGKLAAVLVLKPLKKFKKKMDYTEYGGAPLMGIAQPVIKAHGSSNPKAFMNAIRQARNFVQQEVIADIRAGLDKINLEHPAE